MSNTTEQQQMQRQVSFARLELYNHALPCGPKAIRAKLAECSVRPLPSLSTIAKILVRQGLTHGRTGWYEGDEPVGAPANISGKIAE